MEIEVGKAYRSRLGERVEIVGYYGYSDYPFRDENGRYYTPEGNYWACGVEYGRDLISEWTDEPAAVAVSYTSTSESTLAVNAAPKYRAGDHITLKATVDVAADLNKGSPAIFSFRESDIISHTPAPFDWKDVKPGMAFRSSVYENHYILYVGPNFGLLSNEYPYTFFRKPIGGGGPCDFTVSFNPSEDLTRAPEHDIEVVG